MWCGGILFGAGAEETASGGRKPSVDEHVTSRNRGLTPPARQLSFALRLALLLQRQGHEGRLRADLRRSVGVYNRCALYVGAVGLHVPRLAVIFEANLQDLPQALAQSRCFDGRDGLDTLGEIALHPV